MPLAISPGPAIVVVQPPEGPALSQSIDIRGAAPGLYSGIGTGVPGGFAANGHGEVFPLVTCSSSQGCYPTPLPLSSTPGGLDFVLYGTGFPSGPARMRIGTYPIKAYAIQYRGGAGVDTLRFHLPQGFPLRLYQAVLAETTYGNSNVLWVYLE
jgi:hypothetical protein